MERERNRYSERRSERQDETGHKEKSLADQRKRQIDQVSMGLEQRRNKRVGLKRQGKRRWSERDT
jgi:hypothetical protein